MSKNKNCYANPDLLKAWADITNVGDSSYRHYLQRNLKMGTGVCIFVMLNPSKADAMVDDPTIEKCMKYCKRWEYKSLIVVNLFDLRATNPEELKKVRDPYGPKRNGTISNLSMGINPILERVKIVCAWGNHGKLWGRDKEIMAQLKKHFEYAQLECFKTNKNGTPVHPLYQKDAAQTIVFKRG